MSQDLFGRPLWTQQTLPIPITFDQLEDLPQVTSPRLNPDGETLDSRNITVSGIQPEHISTMPQDFQSMVCNESKSQIQSSMNDEDADKESQIVVTHDVVVATELKKQDKGKVRVTPYTPPTKRPNGDAAFVDSRLSVENKKSLKVTTKPQITSISPTDMSPVQPTALKKEEMFYVTTKCGKPGLGFFKQSCKFSPQHYQRVKLETGSVGHAYEYLLKTAAVEMKSVELTTYMMEHGWKPRNGHKMFVESKSVNQRTDAVVGNLVEFFRKKVNNNPDMKRLLLDNRGCLFLYATTFDDVLGCGVFPSKIDGVDVKKMPGQNLVGIAMAKVQDQLVAELEGGSDQSRSN